MPGNDVNQAARENSEAIYAIVNRLAEPPTPAELEKIQQLIDAGADLERRYNDGNRETVLDIALTREYTEAALLFVKNGADLNARCVQEITPFIWAAMKGNYTVLKAMFDSGRAPPPDRDSYDSVGTPKTALMCAAGGSRQGCADCALELIRHGADVHLKNSAGMNAPDYARENMNFGFLASMEREAGRREAEKLRDGTAAPVAIGKPLRFKTPKA